MNKRLTKSFKRSLVAGFLLPLLAYDAGAQERLKVTEPLTGLTPDSVTVPTLNGLKSRKYLTGAISYISGNQLSTVPGTNRFNSLAGRLPGLSVTQNDGLPGAESSSLLVRGYHTFSGSTAPLVLINGRRDDPTMLEPNDIESITILKDAASTVLYGMNSANGILLITTKRGKEGKININYNNQTTFQQPTRMPKFLDAYNYATLYNEAMLNDNPNATVKYDAAALQAYRTGSDPYRYPNVDWTGSLLKDYSIQTRNNLNVSGGGKTAKYFFSGSYLSDGGIFNVNESINKYNTNTNIDVVNVRANVDLQVAKNLSLITDVRSKREKRNAPGAYSTSYDESIFATLYGTPANAHPILNADGSLAGTNDYRNNPYGLLNYRGYSNYIVTSLSTASELTYDIGSLLEGLKIKANFGFTNYTNFIINRAKSFEVYGLDATGTGYTKFGASTPQTTSGGYDQIFRIFDHSVSLNYDRNSGLHNISAMLMYDRDQLDNQQTFSLTRNFQGPKASFSYRYNNKYLLDLAASYEGSEQYAKGDRYGFFPAVGAGWIVSEESFLKDKGVDFLKLRGSWGITGNPSSRYFDYLGSFVQAGGGGYFGTTPAMSIGIYESKIANPAATWEKNRKANAGLDLALFKNRLSASFDYFNEENKDILIMDAISGMYGTTKTDYTGSFKNKGYEFQAGWGNKVRDLQYSLNLNFSRARSEIVNKGEESREYPWMYETGTTYGSRRGYVFDRFFTEQDNMASLPDQTLLGSQQPGDLKYKDLNGDNIINDKDITEIGDGRIPLVNFGANLGLAYKGFDFNVFFQGTDQSTSNNLSNASYREFYGTTGNASEHHLSRWTPGSGQSAGYPRLTLSNTNNFVASSYWLQDNSFVRLKFMELGYTFPAALTSRVKMSGARLFINGNNVLLWDNVDNKDPELQDNGIAYPLQRTFSIGLNAKF